jgi:hypothetical protein
VGFVVSDGESLSDQGKALIRGAEARHAAKRAVTEWPGTAISGTGTVTMYLMPAESNLDLILSAAPNLYGWVNYDLPEDPFFLRDDNSALLTTTAHEEHAHLTLTSAELEQLQTELPWIRPMLRPMGYSSSTP